jgi:hypothetical protein
MNPKHEHLCWRDSTPYVADPKHDTAYPNVSKEYPGISEIAVTFIKNAIVIAQIRDFEEAIYVRQKMKKFMLFIATIVPLREAQHVALFPFGAYYNSWSPYRTPCRYFVGVSNVPWFLIGRKKWENVRSRGGVVARVHD